MNMKTKIQRTDLVLFLLAVIALLFFIGVYPRLYPHHAVRIEMSSDEILRSAVTFVQNLGYDLGETDPSIQLEHHADQIRYLERTFGTERANALMSDSIPAFFWSIHWIRESAASMESTEGTQEEQFARVMERIRVENRLLMDLKGRPIDFNQLLGRAAQ